MAIILAVLVLLNTYPLLVSQDMMFRSKETSLKSSVKVIESSLSGLSELTVDGVEQALSGMETTGVSRVLVTDLAGRILYDSREVGGAEGLYVFYTEVALALSGNDAFHCVYDSTAFLSRMAAPVVYHNKIVGAVYAYEYDTVQAQLLKNFQSTLLKISVMIALLAIFLSFFLSRVFTASISELLIAIRKVREGAYGHRASIKGKDEIAQLAVEFNSLTDRLQTTEDARRRFVSDASHELKTPLAGIRLLTDSILQTEDIDNDTAREFLGDIGEEAQRLTRITEDLLRLTRLDSGAVPEAVPVSVVQVAERVERMLSMVAEEKGVALLFEADEQTAVMATEDDVHQVLYNLVENGIKYTEAGGFVQMKAVVEDQTVVITVADNGVGVPEEDIGHVFERFYRVDKARSRAVGGTGLGLAIVKDTVENRGGSIAVSHREGGGTVFTVRMPLAKREEAAE